MILAPMVHSKSDHGVKLLKSEAQLRKQQQHIQHVITQKWNKFFSNYVSFLHLYRKPQRPSDVKVGDLLLYKNPLKNLPPGTYPLALVVECMPGRDPQIIRNLKVRMKDARGNFYVSVKPVEHFVNLEIGSDDQTN